jgi:hypothetical protein
MEISEEEDIITKHKSENLEDGGGDDTDG